MKVKLQYERFYPSGDYCSPCDLFDGQECILRLDNGEGGPSQLCPIFDKEEGFYVFELAEGVEKLKSDNARLREALKTTRATMIEVSETLFRKGIADMRLKIVVECIDAALAAHQ